MQLKHSFWSDSKDCRTEFSKWSAELPQQEKKSSQTRACQNMLPVTSMCSAELPNRKLPSLLRPGSKTACAVAFAGDPTSIRRASTHLAKCTKPELPTSKMDSEVPDTCRSSLRNRTHLGSD